MIVSAPRISLVSTRAASGPPSVGDRCSGLRPATRGAPDLVARYDMSRDPGASLIDGEFQSMRPAATASAARKFICGAPRKPATKRLRGRM